MEGTSEGNQVHQGKVEKGSKELPIVREDEMAESKPKLKELEGEYSGFSHFGVTMLGGLVPEDKMGHSPECKALGCEVQHLEVWPNDLVRITFRCDACGTVFDVTPDSKDEGNPARSIPLCPKECNIEILEKWVEDQRNERTN
jgi:hypothetical protein